MNSDRTYVVYILARRHHGTLCIGVSNDLSGAPHFTADSKYLPQALA